MKNKVILITGGTTGIGLATAQLLGSEGAKILVTGRNPDTLEAAKKLLPDAIIFKSDSASLEDALALGNLVKEHTQKLDGVFLNAGIGQFAPIEAATSKQFDDMFNVNVRGLFFQLQSLLPLLAKPSSVVFTSSIAATASIPNASLYSATKAAVVSFGKTLAVELAPRGVRVNVISPGPIDTPIFNKIGLPEEAVKAFVESNAAKSLVKRVGTADEVARLARFLLSEDSSNIVGTEIVIDGGMLRT